MFEANNFRAFSATLFLEYKLKQISNTHLANFKISILQGNPQLSAGGLIPASHQVHRSIASNYNKCLDRVVLSLIKCDNQDGFAITFGFTHKFNFMVLTLHVMSNDGYLTYS
jgi:hypothetical protein